MAELARVVLMAAGKKKAGGADFSVSDFMQWGAPEEEREATLQDVFAMLQNARIK